MRPKERADTTIKRPQSPVLRSLISCPSEASESSLPHRFFSRLPGEINYVTTNSFPQQASKGTLASQFSAHSLTGETGLFLRGEGGGEWERKARKDRPLVTLAGAE